MKVRTTKEKILEAALVVERITGKKESLPILSCILIEAGKEISLRATNLEAGVNIRIPGTIEEKGIVAVPAAVLTQTLRSIGADAVSLRTEGGNLYLESRGTKTLIKAIPHEEFPSLGSEERKGGNNIPRTALLNGLQSVLYAASHSMIRPELGSVYVSIKQTGLVCVATDSFRLAEKTVPCTGMPDGGEILIPLKHAAELSYILERIPDEKITLRADDAQLSIFGAEIRFVSRVVEGTFPNYQEIIPKEFTAQATTLKNDFAEMLRKARSFSGNDQHVGLHVYPKRKMFTATAQNPDVGEMSDALDAALEGDDIDINFHIGYLAECLPSISADSIILGFSGADKPLVIRGVSDASFTYLVMPLNR